MNKSIDNTLLQGLTAGLEALINQALKYDPATQQQLAKLTDTLAIELTSPNITLYFRGQEDGIALFNHCEAPVSTRIKGSPSALLSLLEPNVSIAKSGVSIIGDAGVLQQWQIALQPLDIGWEEAVSQIFGDIAGPVISKNLRSSSQWAAQQVSEHQRLLKEYVTEEIKLIPSKAEVEHFYDGLSQTKMDTDRLAARIRALQTTLQAHMQTHMQTTQSPPPTSGHTGSGAT